MSKFTLVFVPKRNQVNIGSKWDADCVVQSVREDAAKDKAINKLKGELTGFGGANNESHEAE